MRSEVDITVHNTVEASVRISKSPGTTALIRFLAVTTKIAKTSIVFVLGGVFDVSLIQWNLNSILLLGCKCKSLIFVFDLMPKKTEL